MRTTYDSPIGPLTLIGDAPGRLTAVRFAHEGYPGDEPDDPSALAGACAAFDRYFGGARDAFDGLAVQFGGTAFQRAVWDALIALPYGATVTYGQLAAQLGARAVTSARAIGSANARTPIPIVMACHRVVGAGGSLTGYRGGLQIKRALLAFETSGGDPEALHAALAASADERLALL